LRELRGCEQRKCAEGDPWSQSRMKNIFDRKPPLLAQDEIGRTKNQSAMGSSSITIALLGF
jgi:hypothetical protein